MSPGDCKYDKTKTTQLRMVGNPVFEVSLKSPEDRAK